MCDAENAPSGGARQDRSPITRAEALAQGLSLFFTGKPCPHGHVVERYVSGRQCLECARRFAAERYRLANLDRPVKQGGRCIRSDAREEAMRAGLKRYSTGIPCRKGHLSERKVCDGKCIECQNEGRRIGGEAKPSQGPALTVEEKAERYDRYLERCRFTEAKRNARKKGQLGQADWTDIERLLKGQKWKCVNCGTSVKKAYHIDHIVPLARGGLHDRRNLQILCPTCNVRKNDKHPVDWALSMGRLV